eukprot:TRINITY_DN34374_c0_g1_i2.p1 TRINITY_DN34374_c0_g1~~TRINITY_DN34374_c0_g1_i2.p1  ORF type:complete len:937 (+),score=214.59 TRINITY_DN34374_c0_g1_i2:694-3504(+)
MSTADPRYVWNQQLCEPFLRQGVRERWFTPVMQGFVQLRDLPGSRGTQPLQLLLIARRSSRHAGTRYNARGIDDEGEVANWIESEMLAKVSAVSGAKEHWLSLTQVRGSAPVFWEQKSSASTLTVTRGSRLGAVAFEKHQASITEEYGDVLYVNLLSEAASKSDTEGALAKAFREQLELRRGIDAVHLDFHARVAGGEDAFDRELDDLYNTLSRRIESFGFLEADLASTSPQKQQHGVVRTNCFDSLDRTNTLQYQVAWRWLQKYCIEHPSLRSLVHAGGAAGGYAQDQSFGGGLFGAMGDMISQTEPQSLQALLRSMWADQGDVLSEQYTGAASTMGAALRQGGHTAFAMLEKGWRSVNRAYCAHFEDSARQAAMDLLLQRHRLSKVPGEREIGRSPTGKLLIAAVTWNLHGHPCWESPAVMQNLVRGACKACQSSSQEERNPDVVIFAFQEFAELTAANVVLLGSGDEQLQERFDAAAVAALENVLGESYVQVRGAGMVGLFLGVYVAARLKSLVKAVGAERVASGLYGQAGNKGAVAVNFKIEDTSICALSLHLESGHGSKKAAERAAQLREVLERCLLPGGKVSSTESLKVKVSQDIVIVAGDFNFRAVLPEEANPQALRRTLASGWVNDSEIGLVGEGIKQVPEEVLRLFRECDELQGVRGPTKAELRELLKEFGLAEGPVFFPPTYRLVEGESVYDTEREPAWCDRLLLSGVSVIRKGYAALGGLTQSDHRPVCVLLEALLLALPPQAPAVHAAPAKAPADLLSGAVSRPAVASNSPAASSSTSGFDLLDFDSSDASPKEQKPLRGLPPPAGSNLAVGRLVYAEFQGGWYLANITRSIGDTVDVAWLRPQGSEWGNKEEMERYLCSTGADETLHGDKLKLASSIRLPSSKDLEQRQKLLQLSHAGITPDLLGDAPASSVTAGSTELDLLG